MPEAFQKLSEKLVNARLETIEDHEAKAKERDATELETFVKRKSLPAGPEEFEFQNGSEHSLWMYARNCRFFKSAETKAEANNAEAQYLAI